MERTYGPTSRQHVQDVTQWKCSNEQSRRSTISVGPYYPKPVPCTHLNQPHPIHRTHPSGASRSEIDTDPQIKQLSPNHSPECLRDGELYSGTQTRYLQSRLPWTQHFLGFDFYILPCIPEAIVFVLGISQVVSTIPAQPSKDGACFHPWGGQLLITTLSPGAEIAFCQWLDAPRNRPPTKANSGSRATIYLSRMGAHSSIDLKRKTVPAAHAISASCSCVPSRTDPRQLPARTNYVLFQGANATCRRAPPGTALCRRRRAAGPSSDHTDYCI
ncbi:hypothetical protein DFH06DRAFT_239814 [Mycena polygramma]|nr:hypothetical protein DFH06DRAFT_239814 [Mycena polygramma]